MNDRKIISCGSVSNIETLPGQKPLTPYRAQEEGNNIGMADWKRRHAFFIKCVSIILTVLFLHQQIGWAQDGQAVWAQAKPQAETYRDRFDVNGIKIPYDVASTHEAVSGKGEDVIIHIQDAHASLSAQYSIANLLDSLVTNYDLRLIALEGSNGYINTSLLKTFPDESIRDNTADFLMREGRMSAGEFFQITNDGPEVSLYGIEDDTLYRDNLDSFRRVASERVDRTENIIALLDQLDLMEEEVCSEELRTLNRNAVLHRGGRMGFTDHWKYINELAAAKDVDLSKYPELSKLLQSIELEEKIDFAKANRERGRLINELSREMDKDELETLVLKSLEFKQSKMSQRDFHSYLIDLAERKGIPAAGYENLINFTRYVSIYESVELFMLYREMSDLEDRIREQLYKSDDERDIYRMSKMARLLKQLYNMELTNDEYNYIRANYAEYSAPGCAAMIKDISKKHNVAITGGYDLGQIFAEKEISDAIDFYLDAEARNESMLVNTIKRMRKEGKHVAALITGGYHTTGLTDLMRQKKLSYLVVIPKFEAGKERPYVAILTNKKKAYEKLLESGKYELAVEAYFSSAKGDLSKMKSALFYAIGEAAILGKDIDAIKSLWAQSYRERYQVLDAEGKLAEMAFEPVKPENFEDFLQKRVIVEKVGDTAVIADRTEEGISFITLARRGEQFEFNPASRAQREVFLARREASTTEEEAAQEFAKQLDEMRADLADIKDMLTQMVGGREQLLEQIAKVSADDIRGRLPKPDEATDEEIIAKIRAQRISVPRDWKEDAELSDNLRDLIAKVRREKRPSPIIIEGARGKEVLYMAEAKIGPKMGVTMGEITPSEGIEAIDEDIAKVLADALAVANPNLAEIAYVNVQIERGGANALDITTQDENDDVLEINIRVLEAVKIAIDTRAKRTKAEEYDQMRASFIKALAWMLNHEVRHAVLRTDSDEEEIAVVAYDIQDYLLLDEATRRSVDWLLSARNNNGVDSANFDAVLRIAQKEFQDMMDARGATAVARDVAQTQALSMLNIIDAYLADMRPEGKGFLAAAREQGEEMDAAREIARLFSQLDMAENRANARLTGEVESVNWLTPAENAVRKKVMNAKTRRAVFVALGFTTPESDENPRYVRTLASKDAVNVSVEELQRRLDIYSNPKFGFHVNLYGEKRPGLALIDRLPKSESFKKRMRDIRGLNKELSQEYGIDLEDAPRDYYGKYLVAVTHWNLTNSVAELKKDADRRRKRYAEDLRDGVIVVAEAVEEAEAPAEEVVEEAGEEVPAGPAGPETKEEAIARINAIDITQSGAKRRMLEALGYDVDDRRTPDYIRQLATEETPGGRAEPVSAEELKARILTLLDMDFEIYAGRHYNLLNRYPAEFLKSRKALIDRLNADFFAEYDITEDELLIAERIRLMVRDMQTGEPNLRGRDQARREKYAERRKEAAAIEEPVAAEEPAAPAEEIEEMGEGITAPATKEEAIARINAIDITQPGAKRRMLEALGFDVDHPWTQKYIRQLASEKEEGPPGLTAKIKPVSAEELKNRILVILDMDFRLYAGESQSLLNRQSHASLVIKRTLIGKLNGDFFREYDITEDELLNPEKIRIIVKDVGSSPETLIAKDQARREKYADRRREEAEEPEAEAVAPAAPPSVVLAGDLVDARRQLEALRDELQGLIEGVRSGIFADYRLSVAPEMDARSPYLRRGENINRVKQRRHWSLAELLRNRALLDRVNEALEAVDEAAAEGTPEAVEGVKDKVKAIVSSKNALRGDIAEQAYFYSAPGEAKEYSDRYTEDYALVIAELEAEEFAAERAITDLDSIIEWLKDKISVVGFGIADDYSKSVAPEQDKLSPYRHAGEGVVRVKQRRHWALAEFMEAHGLLDAAIAAREYAAGATELDSEVTPEQLRDRVLDIIKGRRAFRGVVRARANEYSAPGEPKDYSEEYDVDYQWALDNLGIERKKPLDKAAIAAQELGEIEEAVLFHIKEMEETEEMEGLRPAVLSMDMPINAAIDKILNEELDEDGFRGLFELSEVLDTQLNEIEFNNEEIKKSGERLIKRLDKAAEVLPAESARVRNTFRKARSSNTEIKGLINKTRKRVAEMREALREKLAKRGARHLAQQVALYSEVANNRLEDVARFEEAVDSAIERAESERTPEAVDDVFILGDAIDKGEVKAQNAAIRKFKDEAFERQLSEIAAMLAEEDKGLVSETLGEIQKTDDAYTEGARRLAALVDRIVNEFDVEPFIGPSREELQGAIGSCQQIEELIDGLRGELDLMQSLLSGAEENLSRSLDEAGVIQNLDLAQSIKRTIEATYNPDADRIGNELKSLEDGSIRSQLGDVASLLGEDDPTLMRARGKRILAMREYGAVKRQIRKLLAMIDKDAEPVIIIGEGAAAIVPSDEDMLEPVIDLSMYDEIEEKIDELIGEMSEIERRALDGEGKLQEALLRDPAAAEDIRKNLDQEIRDALRPRNNDIKGEIDIENERFPITVFPSGTGGNERVMAVSSKIEVANTKNTALRELLDNMLLRLAAVEAAAPEEAPEPEISRPEPAEAPAVLEPQIVPPPSDLLAQIRTSYKTSSDRLENVLSRQSEVMGDLQAAKDTLQEAIDGGMEETSKASVDGMRLRVAQLEEEEENFRTPKYDPETGELLNPENFIDPLDQFYYATVQQYDKWLAGQREVRREPSLGDKVDMIFDLIETNLAGFIAADYKDFGFDSMEILTGKKMALLKDFALQVILARERQPATPEAVELIKRMIDERLEKFFMPGTEGQEEKAAEVKTRVREYLGGEGTPLIRNMIVLTLLGRPDPEVEGNRLFVPEGVPAAETDAKMQDMEKRFAGIATEVSNICSQLGENMVELTFMEFQLEYLGYKLDALREIFQSAKKLHEEGKIDEFNAKVKELEEGYERLSPEDIRPVTILSNWITKARELDKAKKKDEYTAQVEELEKTLKAFKLKKEKVEKFKKFLEDKQFDQADKYIKEEMDIKKLLEEGEFEAVEKTIEEYTIVSQLEDKQLDLEGKDAKLQLDLIEVLTKDDAFPELKVIPKEELVDKIRKAMGKGGKIRGTLLLLLGTTILALLFAAGCAPMQSSIRNIPATMERPIGVEEEGLGEILPPPKDAPKEAWDTYYRLLEEEKAKRAKKLLDAEEPAKPEVKLPEFIPVMPDVPSPLKPGRVTIVKRTRGPPVVKGPVRVEPWHGGETFQQAFRGGLEGAGEPGDVIINPFMFLDGGKKQVVFPKVEDFFVAEGLNAKTPDGKNFRWQFHTER
ncbi:MAG: hypothetical protein WBD12_07155, partial [Candidatus Omnitrophota bacterium]